MTQAAECRMEKRKTVTWDESRLRRHSDYQRVYSSSRKQFSASMTYFIAVRGDQMPARVGLTAGRVLGKAVERNLIKRRMREAVRKHLSLLPPGVDVVLHPRKSVMTMEFAVLDKEVGAIFSRVADATAKKRPGASQSGERRENPSGAEGRQVQEHAGRAGVAGKGRSRVPMEVAKREKS